MSRRQRVTRRESSPVCGKPDWCAWNRIAACSRRLLAFRCGPKVIRLSWEKTLETLQDGRVSGKRGER